MSEELKAECVTAFEAAAVRNEMARIRALFVKSPDDAKDLITYAKEVVRLRTPTEPGEAEVAKQLAAALTAIHEARLRKGSADKGYGWNITKLNKAMDAALPLLGKPVPPKPEIPAAALRSTTPASDVVEAENYASEFVKGEVPADVSRAAVDDYALVEGLGDVLDIVAAAEMQFAQSDEHHAYYRKRHAQVQQAIDRLQSLQASIRVKDDALRFVRPRFVYHEDLDAISKIDEALSQPIGGE